MGSTPPELSLDLNPPSSPPTTTIYTPKSITVFLTEIAKMGSEKSTKLVDDYVKRLEEEMKKIDAFKRELPLCMLLLNDAIVTLKEESISIHCVKKPLEVVVEVEKEEDVVKEFIPLIRNCGGGDDEVVDVKMEKDSSRDKMNWMSSAQLWSNNDCAKDEKKKNSKSLERNERGGGGGGGEEDDRTTTNESTFPLCKYKNGGGGVGGGAFMPFKGFSSGFPVANKLTSTSIRKEEKEIQPVSTFSLLTPPPGIITNMESNSVFFNSRSSGGGHRTVPCSSANSTLQQQQQPPRKQRRCWSPDLHRRFVGALQQLGGSQVATPKQIRELMKVDGLTNDEVKSHLQKYRLHTRRTPNSSTTANQQGVVVLGGLWVSQDQYGTSKSNTSQSESPQGPLQLSGGGGGISTTGGDSMDDDEEEDEKSESYSWKGHHHNKPSESRETDA